MDLIKRTKLSQRERFSRREDLLSSAEKMMKITHVMTRYCSVCSNVLRHNEHRRCNPCIQLQDKLKKKFYVI